MLDTRTGAKKTHSLIAPLIPGGISGLSKFYALVVTSTLTKNKTMVSIGGAQQEPLKNGIWYDNTNINMSFYSMPLTNDTASYIFSNPNGLIIYGYAYGTLAVASYYYLAGSAMRDLDAYFTANDIHFQDLKDTAFCNKKVNFCAEIEEQHQSIKWYVDSKDGNGFIEETSALNQTEWNRPFENGTYEIKMVVTYDNDTYVTRTGTLKVQALWIKIRNVRY